VAVVVVGVPEELLPLPDRVGNTETFWTASARAMA
jgi:hypothetical protein